MKKFLVAFFVFIILPALVLLYFAMKSEKSQIGQQQENHKRIVGGK